MNLRCDTSWKLASVPGFCQEPWVWCSMPAKVAPCFVAFIEQRWGKMFSILHSRVTRMLTGSKLKGNHFSLWHWELQEVSSWRHRRSPACILPWFSLARNLWDQFLKTHQSKARRIIRCLINISCIPNARLKTFFLAWYIKLSKKTWNQRKFSTCVTSKVYCSMGVALSVSSAELPVLEN